MSIIDAAVERGVGVVAVCVVAVRRRRRAVLAVALAVGVLVAAAAVLAPERYRASTTHLVVLTGPAAAGDVGAATAWVAGVASAPGFRDLAAERTGRGVTADEVAAAVAVTADGPGRVTVTATGPDPERVRALAGATGGALVSAVAQRAALGVDAVSGPLRAETAEIGTGAGPAAERQRYAALVRAVAGARSAPTPVLLLGPSPVAVPDGPHPVRDGVLAFLACAVLLAVAIPAWRAARGLVDEVDPVPWVTGRTGVPAVAVRPGPDPSPLLGELYREHLRALGSVTVVQMSRPDASALGARIASAAGLAGDRREHHDADGGVPEPADAWVRTLRATTLDELTVRTLRDTGPTVLAAPTAGTRRRDVERLVSGLRAIGAAPVAAVVLLGRFPR